MAKITKLSFNEKDIPTIDTIVAYVETLHSYLKDNPNTNKMIAKQIHNLPTPRKIEQDFSLEECKLLFETINYLWRTITGSDICEESKHIKTQESLMGNYWLIKNGLLLHGVNHFGIIKSNANMFCSLLDINAFALQHYMAANPNKLIFFIIKSGGIRMYVNSNRKGYFQLSSETYGDWGKNKISKFDLSKKIVKVVDPNHGFDGWDSGISIIV